MKTAKYLHMQHEKNACIFVPIANNEPRDITLLLIDTLTYS